MTRIPMKPQLQKIGIFLFSLFAPLFWYACGEGNPSDPPVKNDHPPATTVEVMLVPIDSSGTPGTDTLRSLIRDTTVVKGRPPVVGVLSLKQNSAYKGRIFLYDESKSPVVDITSDIEQEKDGHVFFYTPIAGIDETRMKITDLDKDSRSFDVGLSFRVATTAGPALSGKLNVLLRHYDSLNKNDTVYDTDLNVSFPVTIQ